MTNMRSKSKPEGVPQGTLDWIDDMFGFFQEGQTGTLTNLNGDQGGGITSLARSSSRDLPSTISSLSTPVQPTSQYTDTLPRSHFAAERSLRSNILYPRPMQQLHSAGQRPMPQQCPPSPSRGTHYQHSHASPKSKIHSSTFPMASTACSTSLAHSSLYQTDDLPQPFGGSANRLLPSTQTLQPVDTQGAEESFAQPPHLETIAQVPRSFSPEMDISPTFPTNPQIPTSALPYSQIPSQIFSGVPTSDPIRVSSHSQQRCVSPSKRRRTLPSEPDLALQPTSYYSDASSGPPSLFYNSSSHSSSMTPATLSSSSQRQFQQPISRQHTTRSSSVSVPGDRMTIFPCVESLISPERARDLERNRVAAKKSRNKRREYTEGLALRSREYGVKNRVLKDRVQDLQDEVQGLRDQIRRHRGCGGWNELMERGVESYLGKVDEQESQQMVKRELDDENEVVGGDRGRERSWIGHPTSGIVKMEDEDS